MTKLRESEARARDTSPQPALHWRSEPGRKHLAEWARALPAVLALLLAGCAAPLRVSHVQPEEFYREQNRNVLSSGDLSEFSRTVLRRHDLLDSYEKKPGEAIVRLRQSVLDGGGGSDEIFTLAELSLFEAARDQNRADYLAAAFYAYVFLFPDEAADRPQPLDPRTRVACDLYNRALGQAFRVPAKEYLEPQAGPVALPWGAMEVAFDPASLEWSGYRLVDLTPIDQLRVEGMRNRYREPGIGVPLAARLEPPGGQYTEEGLIGPNVRVPVTAVLRIDQPRQQLASASPQATLEVHATVDDRAIVIDDETVALEAEPTAAIASSLVASRLWDLELASFLGDTLRLKTKPTLLRAVQPYTPGKIPVVFVHGTASSPFRWADMINDLQDDPRIRARYQFWFFTYDSGNPIAYSAFRLRQSLARQVAQLDPAGSDPALHRMVVIGHSQGGLLTKMTAIHSGDRFWRNISGKPFDEVSLSPDTRELLREALFIEPLPFVKRVIFIATPHRGSYLAGPQIVRRLVQRLVRLPVDVVGVGTELTGLSSRGDTYLSGQRMPTSIDNMSPGHPFIRALSETPIDPAVKAHSIIPVAQPDGVPGGNDGVVEYRSAHIDGVESELVVQSSHSTQANPHTIEEVRRILLLHLAEP